MKRFFTFSLLALFTATALWSAVALTVAIGKDRGWIAPYDPTIAKRERPF